MFTVYHSNQLDLLTTLAASLITNSPLRDPFKSEVILVESMGMAQWVQMELAAHCSIAANIEFPRPANFIWKLFTRILPDIPDEIVFSKPAMTWQLMALLPRLCRRPDFAAIKEYLHDDADQRKNFQFSSRLADLFNQYLIYRPDWLESWQCGKLIERLGESQRWQAALWQALMDGTKRAGQLRWHHANLYKHFIQTLVECQTQPCELPERVFVCGISTLPPIYLQVLQALGRHIDIHLLFTNPCRYYWGDIRQYSVLAPLIFRRRQHQKKIKQMLSCDLKKSPKFFYNLENNPIGNPLLSSWGKQGRDYLYLLAQIDDIVEVKAFIEPVGNNLLTFLQRDILALENHAVINMGDKIQTRSICKRPLQLRDRSLSMHVCHSAQREVEVLHDSLLGMMLEDPTLRPREIIVMVTDIDRYTPVIQAVFGNAEGGRYLPFTISDRKVKYFHPVLRAFFSLLELPRSRFTAEEIVTLLEVPALAARFAINANELQLLRRWVTESGICWGLDDETQRELMLPVTRQNTWEFGLTRMLLGYAMASENGVWRGILPYDEASGLIATLAGQLAELLVRLRDWRNRLSQPRPLEMWLGCAREMIEDFFAPDDEEAAALALLEDNWQHIIQCGLKVEYEQPVPVTVLQNKLTAQFHQERTSQGFLAGAINFCGLIPMRAISFRVICLLGMNDGIYPRILSPVGFDLMKKQPRRGDRKKRDDDRYLFLEALLSAKQRLYISFIGRTIQNNTPRYPSVLVSELSDYITESFYLPGDEHTDAESSANRVRTHLWQWHSRIPFAPENFLPGSEIQSFATEWLPAASAEGEPQADFVAPLQALPCKALSLDELLLFYYHPVRAWFVQRLAISFQHTSPELRADEPFVIDALTRYQINDRLLHTLTSGGSIDCLFHQVRAAGLLPYGAFGELYWERQCQEMVKLSEQMRRWRLPDTYSFEISLTLENITLSGWLPRVQANGLLRGRPSILSARDGLLLWVEHLAYCAMGGKGESRMFGTSGEWHFAPIPIYQAKKFLLVLISGYCQGMASLLLLLPRSGGAWLKYSYDPISKTINRNESWQKQARNKLIQAWNGNKFVSGESRDPYLQQLIRQLDAKHIEAIMSAAEQYFLPPFRFNLAKST